MSWNEFIILFILPFAVMAIATVVLKFVLPPSKEQDNRTGRLAGYEDLHREAYIGALLAAIISVIVFEIRGGPEPFVLVWLPLLSTVVVLPFGYTVALLIGGLLSPKRSA
ncbi:MAG: hypothetical protein JJ899_16925 [Alphaproteobacteria bacterium]|nr:hypothetical protein [Alphaproteobacteria bacterium]